MTLIIMIKKLVRERWEDFVVAPLRTTGVRLDKEFIFANLMKVRTSRVRAPMKRRGRDYKKSYENIMPIF